MDHAATDHLIRQRRCGNERYYNMDGRSRVSFWETTARRLYQDLRFRCSARQCEQRFRNLIQNFNDFVEWKNGGSRGRWTRTGQRYYWSFRSRFWEQPEMRHSRRHQRNRRYLWQLRA
ncbi:unnamed protein product [Rhizophagus irregularis]|uniref:Uncharacterized protein n=1 Tax=Rhizophagus irregularis TaxID=588596 RepID=A0A916E5Z9_9GLOM|nr:unnamed protein product [Rhizophagus irregularis]